MRHTRPKRFDASKVEVLQGAAAKKSAPDLNYDLPPLRRQILSTTIGRALGLVVVQNAIATTITEFAMGSAFTNGSAPELLALVPTLVMASIASLTALYMAREMVRFPGSSIAAYFPPSLAINFLILATMVVLLRIDYSRVTLVASLFAAMIWLFWDFYFNRRKKLLQTLVVPGGEMRDINELRNVELHWLTRPDDHITGAEVVVADLHHDHSPAWERYIAKCILAGVPVFDIKGLIENLTGRVEIEHLSENSFGAVLPSKFYLRIKHLIDVMLAIVLLPLFAIIILAAAIAIRLETRGSVFFHQQRMGFRSTKFTILKLRSMKVTTLNGEHFTRNDDDRITRVGRFIRKFRIDEIPQIFNILRGEMSWIGPRPEALPLAEWYADKIPYYIYRHAVRPGLTGWAQINQGNVAEIEAATRKLHFDFYYIKNFSPFLDLTIAMKTIYVVLSGFGSI